MRTHGTPVAMRRRFLLSVALLLLAGCGKAAQPSAAAAAGAAPKNIIILYADGTAGTQFEVARYASRYLRNEPFAVTDVVLKQGALGLLTTHPHEAFATDSATTATTMSTGFKSTIGAIGVGPDGQPLRTAMEAAKARGKRIGLVTTASVHDASPAAFSVHAKNRGDVQAIVDQYLALEPDVLMGGGAIHFRPESAGGTRKDGRDMIAAFRAKGYQVARTPAELQAAAGPRVLGLFDDGDLDFEIDRDPRAQPSMADMAAAAIRILAQGSPNGFVLFLENENPDTASHRNDIASLIRDLWVFDRAVQHALEFQRRAPGETLVLVTGDHETGGLSVTYAQKDMSTTSSRNRFYAASAHLDLIKGITISNERAAERLGKTPTPEALDALLREHYPGFRLDPDLREAILKQQMLERNFTYPTQNALGRMVARQTGFYWGTSGHTTEPIVVGAMGPGADAFHGYLDNTDFGKALHRLLDGR
jgi:alkaline phosphatase